MDKLDSIRLKLNEVDLQILCLLKKRMELSAQIGVIKKNIGVMAYNRQAWHNRRKFILDNCANLNIEYTDIISVFYQIHRQSIQIQEKI